MPSILIQSLNKLIHRQQVNHSLPHSHLRFHVKLLLLAENVNENKGIINTNSHQEWDANRCDTFVKPE